MTMRLGALVALSFAVLGGCTQEPQEYLLPPDPARIVSFTASATSIKAGEQVTLAFEAKEGTEAQIIDQRGQVITHEGSVTEGTAIVSPTETSVFVLRVKGAGGSDSAFVRVLVAESLSEVSLVAVPSTVKAGDEVQLVWSAANAATVALVDGNDESLTVDASAGSGMVTVRPTQTTTYRLTATTPELSAPLVSETNVSVTPVIASFTATPGAVLAGETITFNWRAAGVGNLVITEAQFDTVVSSRPLSPTGTGSADWTVPSELPSGETVLNGTPLLFTFTLTGTNPVTSLVAKDSARVGFGPAVDEFSAPSHITRGDGFTLKWKLTGATTLRILRNGLSVYEPLKASPEVSNGQLVIAPPSANESYELEAEDADGNVSRAVRTITIVDVPTVSLNGLPTGQVNANSRVTGTITSTNAARVRLRFKDGPQIEERVTNLASFSVSVQVASTVTLVAEAENAAGRKITDEKTIRVGPLATGTAEISPNPALTGGTLTLNVDVTSLPFNELPGVPTTEIRSSLDAVSPISYDFVDLADIPEATTVQFSEANDAVAKLADVASFAFPLIGTVQREFWVSTNGFMSFANIGARRTPDAFGTGNNLPPMIAPFWMDLAIPSPSTENPKPNVYYLVEGTTFPRTLIVQWNDMSLSFAPAQFTFQVQLSESGSVKYLYKRLASTSDPLSGGGANGENATIGLNLSGSSFSVQHSVPMTATVANNQALQFLNSLNQPLTFSMPATQSGTLRFFGADLSAAPATYAAFALQVRVFGQRDFEVSEVMAESVVGPDGTWIELINRSSTAADLSGLTLTTTAMNSSYLIPANTVVSPGGYLLLAGSNQTASNGGLTGVDLVYGTSLTFTPGSDTVSLLAGTGVLASLSWSSGATAGKSVTAPEPVLTSTGAAPPCDETATYGTAGQTGSPRVSNRSCFGYRFSKIPVAYEDIFLTGDLIEAVGVTLFDKVYTRNVSSAPVKLFGQSHDSVKVSTNGFLVPASVTVTASYKFTSPDPVLLPASGTPNPSIVIFGDGLDDVESTTSAPHKGLSRMLQQYVAPGENPQVPQGHWIFQWAHMEHNLALDDLNFQIKIFDDGVIEFHYADMISGNTSDWASGKSATVWIENIDGTAAMSVGTATAPPALSPFSAYRFTPATP